MNRRTRDKWIVAYLLITLVLWSLLSVGFLIAALASGSPIWLFFSAALGVGAWWSSRLMLEFHSDVDHSDDAPTRLLRSRRRHVAKEN